MPLVTIITPAYNTADYLAETIQSVQRQTLKDFEMLVVDDGSTDATASVAEEFAAGDPRIRLIRQTNTGAAGARNTAIRHARSDLFALLDSDDVAMPTYLESQFMILRDRKDIDIVSSNALNLGGTSHGQPLRPLSDRVIDVSLLDIVQRADAVPVMSVFRRSVIDRIGDFAPIRPNEDYEFWLRAARAGCRIVFNGRPHVWYRRREGSVSANQDAMLQGIIDVLTRLRKDCTDLPVELAAIDQQIERVTRLRVASQTKAALLRFALQA